VLTLLSSVEEDDIDECNNGGIWRRCEVKATQDED